MSNKKKIIIIYKNLFRYTNLNLFITMDNNKADLSSTHSDLMITDLMTNQLTFCSDYTINNIV